MRTKNPIAKVVTRIMPKVIQRKRVDDESVCNSCRKSHEKCECEAECL